MNHAGNVLWWGRFDPDYSRNRVLRQAFGQLGWNVSDFRPLSSMTGDIEASCRNLEKPDLIWVPSFRQRDVAAASRWANRMDVPLVFDPLISSYDKKVFERRLIKEEGRLAKRLLRWERDLFQRADVLVADTSAHVDYFRTEFGVPDQRLLVVPVGAEEELFQPQKQTTRSETVEVLFYGTFIDLQGPLVIVEAAARCQVKNVVWTMLGAGPLLTECQNMMKSLQLDNVRFEPWVAYEDLPQRIGCADILLGAFGVSRKAASVIPNKVYQALACGRPVVTRKSVAYPEGLLSAGCSGLIQIAPGDPELLAETVEVLATSQQQRAECSENARQIYEEFFSSAAIATALKSVVQRVMSF